MKYCPNVACPFLLETGTVAEYQDRVQLCPDCGEVLETGAAPKMKVPPHLQANWQQEDAPEQMVQMRDRVTSLCVLELEEDARFFKEKLEYQGIPTALVPVEVEGAEDNAIESTVQFELRVLNSDLTRATSLLETLGAFDDEMLDDEDDTTLDEELEPEAEQGEQPSDTFDAEPHSTLHKQSSQAPDDIEDEKGEANKTEVQSLSVYQGQISDVTTGSRANKLIPLLMLVLLVLAFLLWLMRTI